MNLALKLSPNKTTEELVGISWTEFKLFIQTEADLISIFPCYKAKKLGSFFTSLDESMKANLHQKAIQLGPNDTYFTEELVGISWIEFK